MAEWLKMICPTMRIIGEAATKPEWLEAMRVIYDHELVLFSKTDYVTEIEGVKYECPENSFMIVPPGKKHISREVGKGRGHRRWIHFDWVYNGDESEFPIETFSPAKPHIEFFHLAPGFIPQEILSGKIRSPVAVNELFDRISARWNYGDSRSRFTCRGILLELLLELLCDEDDQYETNYDTDARLAGTIRSRLNSLSETPLNNMGSLQKFLALSGKTYAHQCRVFKKCYGISPLNYVNALRAMRARTLLRDTNMNVSEVAGKLGFENLSYFTRFLKKHTGQSPSSFKNSI